jgi:hypothetical protein
MLVVAAVAHSSASVPLLVIGGLWTLAGGGGAWQNRRLVREIVVSQGVARFISQSGAIEVPAASITEIRHGRFDPNRMGPLTVQTVSNGKIRTSPRLVGLFDVLVELRRSNPALVIRNL